MNVIIPRVAGPLPVCVPMESAAERGHGTIVPPMMKLAALSVLCLLAGLSHASAQTTNVLVDPSRSWIGYMNVFNYPPDGNGPVFGQSWGTADLNAAFSGNVLTFTPNTSIDRDAPTDPFWWNTDGSPAKNMDANFYVQDDTLTNQIITFSGYCWTNTLAEPWGTNATVFIKDFASDYSSSTVVTSNLTGGIFSITLDTTADAPGHHIQYGFEMLGPDARITNAAVDGGVIISSNPPPAGPVITAFPGSSTVLTGGNIQLIASATGSSLSYQWKQNGINLTNGVNIFGATNSTLTLSNITGAAEADYALIASNFSGSATNQMHLTVVNPSHLTIDPRAGWVGYMNVTELPQNGGGFDFGQAWGVSALRATINGGTITLQPNTNTYNPNDPYWVNPDGSGNKMMEALCYQQFDQLTNMVITFTGFCQTNNLDPAYTNTVFIRDFSSDYSQLTATVAPVVSGQTFSITADLTADGPGHHIQWGFDTTGPDANPAIADGLGKVVVTVNPPAITASTSSNKVNLNFATEGGLNYTVQYKTNLFDSNWTDLITIPGTATNSAVTDPAGVGTRFYRVSAH